MELSWEWKLFLLNMTCQSLFAMYTSLTLFIGLGITLPDVYKEDTSTLYYRKLLAIILVICVVGNYVCIKLKFNISVFSRQKNAFIVKDSNGFDNHNKAHKSFSVIGNGLGNACRSDSILGNGRDWHKQVKGSTSSNIAGWSECRHCVELTPPRSKHCPLCRSCILKRDHHCFFAGCCIGFHNQRYFISFCFYGAMGAFYSAFATFSYIKENYEVFQDWGLVSYFPPILFWFWLMGYTSGASVLYVFFLYWNAFTTSLCLYFFLLQTFLVLRGQTKYELKQKTCPYSSDLMRNVMSVFGPSIIYCLVSFLVPLPFVGYFGDGKTWDKHINLTKVA